AAALMLPFALWQLPSQAPGWESVASIAALGIAGTGIAQLLVFRMLRFYGSARSSLVTYLMPPIALVYGVVLLAEPLTGGELAGLVLILLGVGLGSGLARLPRPAPLTQAPCRCPSAARARRMWTSSSISSCTRTASRSSARSLGRTVEPSRPRWNDRHANHTTSDAS